jgi:hypothetical protein
MGVCENIRQYKSTKLFHQLPKISNASVLNEALEIFLMLDADGVIGLNQNCLK